MQKLWRSLHFFIIFNFIFEIAYSFYMVFYAVGGGKWPLMAKAENTPVEVILKRRLYAIESWIAIVGLASYLGLTEFLPQKIQKLLEETANPSV
jgi:hypothetical protein